MKRTTAKQNGFTHEGYQFGFIPVFVKFEEDSMVTEGKNAIWNFLLSIFTEIDLLLETGYSFEVDLREETL
jgi:hypothetical protein